MVGVDRDGLPVHFVSASRQGFGDWHDQHSLVARLRFRGPERHRGAARAGQRNLREFRLDAFAEFEPDFARRGDRAADGRRRLLELGVGESRLRATELGKRAFDLLAPLGQSGEPLAALMHFVLARNR